MQLTQKETGLIKDLKGQEQLCVEKYRKHADSAKDPELRGLLNYIAGVEQGHLQTVTEIQNGQTPSQKNAGPAPTFGATYQAGESEDKKCDSFICSDLLATEKHASHLYDTCIFEFDQQQYRQALGKSQKEEQEHGKLIYDYMKKNSMYS